MDQKNQIDTIAKDVMLLSQNILVMNLRFLDNAISKLKIMQYEGSICTDGEYLYYDPRFILLQYKEDHKLPSHHYLHTIMHCIFHHFFVDTEVMNRQIWDLACDIAIEYSIMDMQLDCVKTRQDLEKQKYINFLLRNIKYLTAEKIYRYYFDTPLSKEEYISLYNLFVSDDHQAWYNINEEIQNNANTGDNNTAASILDDRIRNQEHTTNNLKEKLESWKRISKQVQLDLETFSKDFGKNSAGLIQNLTSVNREKYDYTAFLKKFAVIGEHMQINQDEFDYIYYTYGLSVYNNMPLIEPLEYKETKRIKEFAIVIDTSGSVLGKQVKSFLTKTYNIIKQQEIFFTKINLHIIQCDASVQQDIKITSQYDFDNYLKKIQLFGFGGTDFRPAFQYVDRLIQNKEFTNLKGMLYFTDGYGIFPHKQPNYTTAFVFVREEYEEPEVPAWAIKLVLEPSEL